MARVTGYRSGAPFPLEVWWVDGVWLEKDAAFAYYRMASAAFQDGVRLRPGLGFRSMEYQTELYGLTDEEKKRRGVGASVAKPGHSTHQTGRAIDFSQVLEHGQYAWLKRRAAEFGFHETVRGEPWHWSYDGG